MLLVHHVRSRIAPCHADTGSFHRELHGCETMTPRRWRAAQHDTDGYPIEQSALSTPESSARQLSYRTKCLHIAMNDHPSHGRPSIRPGDDYPPRESALAPRQAQIRRIWRVGACDHLCTATVVTLVFLTGIDGAGDRSRRPDHPRRLVAAVPVGLGSPPQVSGGVIPGGLSQLLGSGCPGGLPPAARNRAPPPSAKSPRDHAGQPGGNRSRLAGCS